MYKERQVEDHILVGPPESVLVTVQQRPKRAVKQRVLFMTQTSNDPAIGIAKSKQIGKKKAETTVTKPRVKSVGKKQPARSPGASKKRYSARAAHIPDNSPSIAKKKNNLQLSNSKKTRKPTKKATARSVAAARNSSKEDISRKLLPEEGASEILLDMWSSDFYSRLCGSSGTATQEYINLCSHSADIRDKKIFNSSQAPKALVVDGAATASSTDASGTSGKPSKRRSSGAVPISSDDAYRHIQSTKNKTDYDLVEPGHYIGRSNLHNHNAALGSRGACQPFDVTVHPQVSVVCDAHAHLSEAEVIGLLAGYWDNGVESMVDSTDSAQTNNKLSCTPVLFVQQAYPCTAVSIADGDDGSTDVELDSVAEWRARQEIERAGMVVVGWYHSHPKFKPFPSLIDIINQMQYQTLLRDSATGLEPFVGLIISTFDPHEQKAQARHQWFHVIPHCPLGRSQEVLNIPMSIDVSSPVVGQEYLRPEKSDDDPISALGLPTFKALFRTTEARIGSDEPIESSTTRSNDNTKLVGTSRSGRSIKRTSRLKEMDEALAPAKKKRRFDKQSESEGGDHEPSNGSYGGKAAASKFQLLGCLAGEYDTCSNSDFTAPLMGINLICNGPPIFRCAALALVSLAFYYCRHHRRSKILDENWRKFGTKLEKMILSVGPLLDKLVPHQHMAEEILSNLQMFFKLCWTQPSVA